MLFWFEESLNMRRLLNIHFSRISHYLIYKKDNLLYPLKDDTFWQQLQGGLEF